MDTEKQNQRSERLQATDGRSKMAGVRTVCKSTSIERQRHELGQKSCTKLLLPRDECKASAKRSMPLARHCCPHMR